MDNNNVLLFLLIGVIIIFLMTRPKCSERFCKVAPRFDHYYHTHLAHNPSFGNTESRSVGHTDNPIYAETEDSNSCNTGTRYSNHYAKQGVEPVTDTVTGGKGCKSCGGDYISVAPKRDRYYQMDQGYLGDNIMSGYPFYNAI